jgi:phosphotransferase system HPr-like phosphotransfer protein
LRVWRPASRFHQFADGSRFIRREQQVHVVGHEAEGVHPHAVLMLELPQGTQVTVIILGLDEHHLAIVTALDNVMRVSRQDNAPHPWHTTPPWLSRKTLPLS